jgi:superfamily II DNA/RNA helicase
MLIIMSMITDFPSLNLADPLLKAVESLGFTAPTSVQAQVIPAALAGGDLMVSSQTGSGKTAAFLLPLLHQLLSREGGLRNAGPTPEVLVLCPTRELAQQVAADAIALVRFVRGLRIATVVGGMPYGRQIAQLRGAQVVIATPGRLLDLQSGGNIPLHGVQQLVVDEADRMLDLGFADDLRAIHELCENLTQTLMFSATFASKIMRLAESMMTTPTRIELATAQDKHANITQTLHWADNASHKHQLLTHWLEQPELEQAVVFASTQADSEAIADELRAKGFQASCLHGAMPQKVRNRRLDALRRGHTQILVATDVAARGIDVPSISHVINFGLPMKPEDYVHRIGRTGRAGRSGIAVTLAEPKERHKIRAIESYTRQPIAAMIVPGLEPKIQSREARPSRGGPRHGGGGGGRREYAKPAYSESRYTESRQEGARGRTFGERGQKAYPKPEFRDGETRPARREFGRNEGAARPAVAPRSNERSNEARAPRFEERSGGFRERTERGSERRFEERAASGRTARPAFRDGEEAPRRPSVKPRSEFRPSSGGGGYVKRRDNAAGARPRFIQD